MSVYDACYLVAADAFDAVLVTAADWLGQRREVRSCRGSGRRGSIVAMAEAARQPLERELEEMGAQLAWVRDYL